MTSRAKRDEVAGIYKCERCNRYEGNVDGEQRLKGETQGGTYHNDKPGQNERDGEGIEREVPM